MSSRIGAPKSSVKKPPPPPKPKLAQDFAKAVFNTQDKADNTALHYACHSGNIQALRLLLDGVDHRVLKLNTPNRMGDTPLHLASARGHANVIQALRDHEYNHTGVRVDIDARNKSGETAFDRAKDVWVKAELIKWHDSRDTASLQMAR